MAVAVAERESVMTATRRPFVMVECWWGKIVSASDYGFDPESVVAIVEHESDLGPRVPLVPGGTCPIRLPRLPIDTAQGTKMNVVAGGDPYVLRDVEILAIGRLWEVARDLLPDAVSQILQSRSEMTRWKWSDAGRVGIIAVRFPSGRRGWFNWEYVTPLEFALPHLALAG